MSYIIVYGIKINYAARRDLNVTKCHLLTFYRRSETTYKSSRIVRLLTFAEGKVQSCLHYLRTVNCVKMYINGITAGLVV